MAVSRCLAARGLWNVRSGASRVRDRRQMVADRRQCRGVPWRRCVEVVQRRAVRSCCWRRRACKQRRGDVRVEAALLAKSFCEGR
jgi:hypothetical protein